MKAGTRLHSAVCATTAVVVRGPSRDLTVECGGAPMLDGQGSAGSGGLKPGYDGGALLGKRYVDEESGLELLCTKGGSGSLSVGGRLLELKSTKPLPASD